jgi:hypothetical protein
MDNVFEYDSVSNALNIMSSKVFDISKGILKMSPSQKASILEGIQQNIDIGQYGISADTVSVKTLVVDGLAFSSSNLELLRLNCSENQIIKVDQSGKWKCAADATSRRRRLLSTDDDGFEVLNHLTVKVKQTEIVHDINFSDGSMFYITDKAGMTESFSNLPCANGTGAVKKVVFGKEVMFGNKFVIGAGIGGKFIGHIYNPFISAQPTEDVAQGVFSSDGTAFDKIKMNGSSSCGHVGDVFTFTDVAQGIWLVEGKCGGHNAPMNPFSV